MTTNNPLLDSLAKPPPPPSELDELMSRDPLEQSAQDIDKIIAYQRQQRARLAAPGKRARKTESDAPSGIDLVALVTKKPSTPTPPPAPTTGGFRRRI